MEAGAVKGENGESWGHPNQSLVLGKDKTKQTVGFRLPWPEEAERAENIFMPIIDEMWATQRKSVHKHTSF